MTDPESTVAPTPNAGWPRGITPFERRFGNAATRIAVAVVAIPLVLATVWVGGLPFVLLVSLIGTAALLEFYWLAESGGARPMKRAGVMIGLVLLASFAGGVAEAVMPSLQTTGASPLIYRNAHLPLVVLVLSIGTMITLVAGMYRSDGRPLRDNVVTIAGVVYVSLSLGMLLGLRSMFAGDVVMVDHLHRVSPDVDPGSVGALAVAAMMASIWTCDSVAYFAGRAFGKTPLFRRISPKKTWEGGVGGGVGAVAAMIGMRFWFLPYLSVGDAVMLGLFAAVGGQIGDLAESHLKRDVGAKDSSNIIPGHGGVLDRFDSLLFVAPLWYLYHLIVVI